MTYYLLSNRQKNRNARCLMLRVACLAGMLILSIGAGAQHKLCNPGATEEARKVYQVLWDVYGKQALSATVANVDWNIKEAENVYGWTGKWPVMNVFDFINFRSSKDVNPNGWLDYSDISTVESWWKQGGLVGCMWHWNMTANDGTSQTCTPGTEPGQTSFDISRIDDTNSDEYKQVIKDIDQIAKYLGKMQEAGIPSSSGDRCTKPPATLTSMKAARHGSGGEPRGPSLSRSCGALCTIGSSTTTSLTT